MIIVILTLLLNIGLIVGKESKYDQYYDTSSDLYSSSITLKPNYSLAIRRPSSSSSSPEQTGKLKSSSNRSIASKQFDSSSSYGQTDDKDGARGYTYVDEEIPHTFTIKHDISDRLAQLLIQPHVTVTKRVWAPKPKGSQNEPSPFTQSDSLLGGGIGRKGWVSTATITHQITETQTIRVTSTTEVTSIVYSTSSIIVGIPVQMAAQAPPFSRPIESTMQSVNGGQILNDLLNVLNNLMSNTNSQQQPQGAATSLMQKSRNILNNAFNAIANPPINQTPFGVHSNLPSPSASASSPLMVQSSPTTGPLVLRPSLTIGSEGNTEDALPSNRSPLGSGSSSSRIMPTF